VLDRVEDGGQAVLLLGEEQVERVVPISRLPEGATPGTWLKVRFSGDQLIEAVIDPDATERARRRIRDKMEQLRRRRSEPRQST